MYEIIKTKYFLKWIKKLNDNKTIFKILRRVEALESGSFGDYKMIDNKIAELRINYGAGYRIYYTIKNNEIILLLIGGDKSTQSRDIEKAKEILKGINNG